MEYALHSQRKVVIPKSPGLVVEYALGSVGMETCLLINGSGAKQNLELVPDEDGSMQRAFRAERRDDDTWGVQAYLPRPYRHPRNVATKVMNYMSYVVDPELYKLRRVNLMRRDLFVCEDGQLHEPGIGRHTLSPRGIVLSMEEALERLRMSSAQHWTVDSNVK